ncbi:MAG: DHA2 family efflux MFS transporter permease subunit, partial [Pseudomonadota bacterium]|nr:DHA2 family efflux MFS transporter permease subunit [Pseudomonadota bacterium]
MGTGESVDDLFRRYGDSYRVLVTVAGMTASFVMVISSTIVNVAIPDVMGAFGIGQDQAQLMATAFNVAMVTSQLLNAWVVAVFGQRYGFCGTLLVFTVGSFIGGFAEDYGMIVFGRVLQGAAAGCIQPLIMVTIFQVFPADRRGFAMGVYGRGLTLAVGLGPVLGGVAIELLDWRYIFLAPIPLVFLALGLGFIFMPSVRKESGQAFDWAGYALINIALFCCMTALTDGQREGWVSNYTTVYSLIALVCGIGFVLWQAHGGETLIDVSLFRNRNFALCAIIAFTFGMGNFGTAYAVPVFGQLVQGQTALDAGNMMLPAALIVVLALPFTGRLADVISPRVGIMAGLALFCLGTLPMAGADANTPYLHLVLFAVVARGGMSFTMPFIMSTALRTLRPEQLNAGGGTINFCRQLGGSLGLNAWVVFLEVRTHYHSDILAATQSADNTSSREMLSDVGRILGEAGVPSSIHEPGALHYLGQVVHAQANT